MVPGSQILGGTRPPVLIVVAPMGSFIQIVALSNSGRNAIMTVIRVIMHDLLINLDLIKSALMQTGK